jgi:hypothetical protein
MNKSYKTNNAPINCKINNRLLRFKNISTFHNVIYREICLKRTHIRKAVLHYYVSQTRLEKDDLVNGSNKLPGK